MSASAVTVLALASGMNAANASTIKIPTAKELLSTSVQPGHTQPDINWLPTSGIQYQAMGVEHLIPLIPLILFGGVVIFVPLVFGGLVVIGERKVGILVKKFALTDKGLPPGRLIGMNGEAGLQADTLAPDWHWGHCSWQYSVKKEPVIVILQGQIAVIVAADGAQNPPERIWAKLSNVIISKMLANS